MKEEKSLSEQGLDQQSTLVPDYPITSWLCHTFAKYIGTDGLINIPNIVGCHLLNLCMNKLRTTEVAISFIDAGIKPKVTEPFVAAKARVDPRAKAVDANKRNSGAHDPTNEMTTDKLHLGNERKKTQLATINTSENGFIDVNFSAVSVLTKTTSDGDDNLLDMV
jgi:hypothetical protein